MTPNPVPAELTVKEKETILRALGYYQIHLFDEIAKKPAASANDSMKAESQIVTGAIKKIHKTIEKKET